MCRLFVLFVCAYVWMSSGQAASPETPGAAQTAVMGLQLAGASVPAGANRGDEAAPHAADSLLAEVAPEVPELSGTAALTLPVGSAAAVYEVRDPAGPRRLFFDGPLHPPRPAGVLL